jgi:hypothetical protein
MGYGHPKAGRTADGDDAGARAAFAVRGPSSRTWSNRLSMGQLKAPKNPSFQRARSGSVE